MPIMAHPHAVVVSKLSRGKLQRPERRNIFLHNNLNMNSLIYPPPININALFTAL